MLFGKKKEKQSKFSDKDKQKYLDEIHQRPEVKKTFVICEILTTIDSLVSLVIMATLALSLAAGNGFEFVDLEGLLSELVAAVGGPTILVLFVVVKLLSSRIKKKQLEKLEILEEAGLEEIQKAIDAGTYVEGPKMPLGYRIFRTARTILISVVGLASLIVMASVVFF